MWITARKSRINFILCLYLVVTRGNHHEREGVSFVLQQQISLGYNQWYVISPFNGKAVTNEFRNLEKAKKELLKNLEAFKNVDKEAFGEHAFKSSWRSAPVEFWMQ